VGLKFQACDRNFYINNRYPNKNPYDKNGVHNQDLIAAGKDE
jgi:hypothetical protein